MEEVIESSNFIRISRDCELFKNFLYETLFKSFRLKVILLSNNFRPEFNGFAINSKVWRLSSNEDFIRIVHKEFITPYILSNYSSIIWTMNGKQWRTRGMSCAYNAIILKPNPLYCLRTQPSALTTRKGFAISMKIIDN